MTQLRELARPFPDAYVHSNPSGGGSYVKHHVIVQRLLQVCGPFDFRVVEVVRGDVAEIPPNPKGNSNRAKQGSPALTNVVVGAVCRLTVTIDGTQTTVEDAGDCEEPHNWKTDGARLKDATSDAIKRCAARIGLGLHLWSGDEFFLDAELDKRQPDGSRSPAPPATTPKADTPRPADDPAPFDAKGSIRDDQIGEISSLLVGEDAPDTLAKILSWAGVDKLEDLSASQADTTLERLRAKAAA